MVSMREDHIKRGMPEAVYEFFWMQTMRATPTDARLEFCVPSHDAHHEQARLILSHHTSSVESWLYGANSSSLTCLSVRWDDISGQPYPPAMRAAIEELHDQLHGYREMLACLRINGDGFIIIIPLTGAFAGWDHILQEEFDE